MPSAKPDKAEIKRLRAERKLYSPPDEDMRAALVDECRAVCGEGFITPAGTHRLLAWLDLHPELAAIFPNSRLAAGLRKILTPGGWSAEAEEALLRFIVGFYLEDDLDYAAISLADMFAGRHFLFGDLYEGLFDSRPDELVLSDRFVAFTGKFANDTRRDCFEQAQALGGVCTDGGWFVDVLFVADEAVAQRATSGKLLEAIATRAMFGRLMILREADWGLIRPGR